MTEKAKNHFLALGTIIRCPFGRPELGRVCSMAWKDKGGRLLCAAMQGWTKSMEVEGLDRCYWTAKNEYKLKIANKRNKDLKSAQQIQKTPGEK